MAGKFKDGGAVLGDSGAVLGDDDGSSGQRQGAWGSVSGGSYGLECSGTVGIGRVRAAAAVKGVTAVALEQRG